MTKFTVKFEYTITHSARGSNGSGMTTLSVCADDVDQAKKVAFKNLKDKMPRVRVVSTTAFRTPGQ